MVLEKDSLNKEEVATPKITVAYLGGLFGKQSGWRTGGLRDKCGNEAHCSQSIRLPSSHQKTFVTLV